MKISRKDFVRLMSVGGASFLTSPFISRVFADQGLGAEARRAGFGEIQEKGVLSNWGRLKFDTDYNPDNWMVHPHGDLNLIGTINTATTSNISEQWNVAEVGKLEQMAAFPLLFMHAESPPKLSVQEKAALLEYLKRGGFLYAEDCVYGYHSYKGGPRDRFFRRMHEVLGEFAKQVEGGRYQRIPLDHPVFATFYELPKGQPHMQGVDHGAHGLFIGKRLVAYLSPSDAHCAWTNEQWFSEVKARQAVQIGTNVYLYAMMHS